MTTSILDAKTKSGVQFGKELREKDFLFDEGYLNLNHGESSTGFEGFCFATGFALNC
jgi:hypothetical protein